MIRTLFVLAVVAGVSLPLVVSAAADPMQCVVVRDSHGDPVQTVCLPG